MLNCTTNAEICIGNLLLLIRSQNQYYSRRSAGAKIGRLPAGNRSDVDIQDGESSEEKIENGENESIDLSQKRKQPAYNSMFYGPLDIRAAGNQFTLIDRANGGKVCSDKDWDSAHKRSESQTW